MAAENFKNPQTVLITGASGALGSVVVDRFLSAGCRVVGTYWKETAPPQAKKGAHWVRIDASESASVRAGLTAARAAGVPEVDTLVHCAGGFRFGKVDELSDDDMDFLIRANLRSAMVLLRELLPGMKERGFGRIVFVSARASLDPSAGMGAYAATKAGLNALVRSAALEVLSHDININAVLPTILDTPANRRDMPKADFSSWVSLESLAEMIFSLTQPWGRPINGALIPVAGRL